MNPYLRVALLVGIAIYFICIFTLLKKKSLNLKYTLLWIFLGIVFLLVVIFPVILRVPLQMIGVVEWTNGLFALLLLILLIINMSITAIVSKMNDRMRKLVQQCAMYEERIRKLEEEQSVKEDIHSV